MLYSGCINRTVWTPFLLILTAVLMLVSPAAANAGSEAAAEQLKSIVNSGLNRLLTYCVNRQAQDRLDECTGEKTAGRLNNELVDFKVRFTQFDYPTYEIEGEYTGGDGEIYSFSIDLYIRPDRDEGVGTGSGLCASLSELKGHYTTIYNRHCEAGDFPDEGYSMNFAQLFGVRRSDLLRLAIAATGVEPPKPVAAPPIDPKVAEERRRACVWNCLEGCRTAVGMTHWGRQQCNSSCNGPFKCGNH